MDSVNISSYGKGQGIRTSVIKVVVLKLPNAVTL